MRPKFVILFFIVIFGVLGTIVLLKRDTRKDVVDSVGQPPSLEVSDEVPETSTNVSLVQVNPNSSNTVALLEQMRAAEIEKELDQIRELESDGAGSETIPMILLAKVTHPEEEVRKAALDALKHLDATNAVPGLEQAVALIKDSREKVAMMDVIDYLKLPSVGSDVPPGTNDESTITPRATNPRPRITNPSRQPGVENRGRRPNQLRPLPTPPATPAPAAPQP